jgi:hypothetical protein
VIKFQHHRSQDNIDVPCHARLCNTRRTLPRISSPRSSCLCSHHFPRLHLHCTDVPMTCARGPRQTHTRRRENIVWVATRSLGATPLRISFRAASSMTIHASELHPAEMPGPPRSGGMRAEQFEQTRARDASAYGVGAFTTLAPLMPPLLD